MGNDVSISICHYDEIDKEKFCTLQRTVFSPMIKQAGGDDSFINEVYFEWKYNTPFGKAYIAIIEKNGKIVGSNSMIPINLIIDGKSQKSWQSCESAVLPEERGNGYFSKCVNQLQKKIKYGEYFWGFPNANSIPGFLKLGWAKNSLVKLWIKPLIYLHTDAKKSEGTGSDDIDFLLSKKISYTNTICLEKTIEYFKWRYINHCCHKYLIMDMSGNNEKAMVVLRELNIKGRRIIMLMDFVGCHKLLRQNFLQKITSFAKENGIHYIGYWGNAIHNIQLLQLGFVPVPNFILPKKQILCGEIIGEPNFGNKNKWILHTGDCDLF